MIVSGVAQCVVWSLLGLLSGGLLGCGNGKSGVVLRVVNDTPSASKPLFKARGDEGDDPDDFITPETLTVGFKSFKLIQQGETTPRYSLFDVDFASPKVVTLTSEPQQVAENISDPSVGSYDRIEYAVSYYEMPIPICDAQAECESRKIRFYLTDVADKSLGGIPIQQQELLVSTTENGTQFGWMDDATGLATLFPLTGPRPALPYRVPGNQFPSRPSPTFSMTLSSPISVPETPEGKYTLTLHFDLSALFFYDDTDSDEPFNDCGDAFCFNGFADANVSRDGKRFQPGKDCPFPCNRSADFWPGLPDVTVDSTLELHTAT